MVRENMASKKNRFTVSRRNFIRTVGASGLATGVLTQVHPRAQQGIRQIGSGEVPSAPDAGAFAPGSSASEQIVAKLQGYASWIEIDLDAIASNLGEIRRHTAVEIMPVVKNNAYGHGLVPVADYLTRRHGIKRLFVAKFREALELREAGLTASIVNMGPLFSAADYRATVERDITHVVFTEEAARQLSDAARQTAKDAGIFVKIDTGLRRVGVWHEEAADFIQQVAALPGIRVDGIFSTFIQVPEQDRLVLERFTRLESQLKARGLSYGVRSLASSDAIFHFGESYLDLVRPGMSLYGVHPEPKDRKVGLRLRQALSFKARIELVKWVNEGESVTYWGRFVAPRRMRIGTIHVGFYDGLPRELSNQGKVFYAGAHRAIIGSVSLNHILVDLTDTDARVGDVVDVIGREAENNLNAVAETSGWTVYSLMNHLDPRTPRVYLENGQPVALA